MIGRRGLVLAAVACFAASYALDGVKPWDSVLFTASLGFVLLALTQRSRS